MKNIISFSLWGDKPMYLIGSLNNTRLAKDIYPGWVCRFYVDRSVSEETLNKLRSEGAEIVLKPDNIDTSGAMWRFEPAFDPEVKYFIVRDADSRLTIREKAAVDEWLSSGKAFHVMRDHPNHNHVIMGGMWGGVSGKIPKFKDILESYAKTHNLGFWSDTFFLRDCIWESYVKHDHISHDEYWRPTGHEKKFPMGLKNIKDFVGNKYDETSTAVYDLIRDDISSSGRILYITLGLDDPNMYKRLIQQKASGVNLYIFAIRDNIMPIIHMLKDLPNVHIIEVSSDAEAKAIIEKYSDFILDI